MEEKTLKEKDIVVTPIEEKVKPYSYDIEKIVKKAREHAELAKQIKLAVFAITNQEDWVDMGGKPYLQASGCEKIARIFGISWKLEQPELVTYPDGHFEFVFTGKFAFGPITENNPTVITATGSRCSRDGFFKTRYKKAKNGKYEQYELPPEEIDPGDVRKSAESNCIGRGIKKLLGLENLDWTELEQHGIKKGSKKVEYKANSPKENSDKSDAIKEKIIQKCKEKGLNDNEIKDFLSYTTSGQENVKIYSTIWNNLDKYIEKWKNQQNQQEQSLFNQ